MELMLISIFLIFIVLAIYLVVEESVMRRYGLKPSIEEMQASVNAWHEYQNWIAEPPAYTLLDRLSNIIRW